MASQAERRARVLQMQARARQQAQGAPAPAAASMTAAPSGPTPPSPGSGPYDPPPAAASQQEAPLMGRIARGVRQGQGAFLQGMTAGASDEMLALADTAAGRGSVEETLAGRQRQLAETPAAIRVPAEMAGAVVTTAAAPGMAALRGAIPYGAAYGYAAGEGDVSDRAESAAYGAGGALAGNLLFRGLARIVSPKSSPQVQTLREEGVTPTPGQTLGGFARNVEEKISSVPVLGSAVQAGERRAIQQFNTSAINRALKPAGIKLPKGTEAGYGAIQAADDAIGRGYDDVLRGAKVSFDQGFADDIARVGERARQELNDQGRAALTREIEKFTTHPELKAGEITGRTAKEVLSGLRSRAREFGTSQDVYTRDVGRVMSELADSWSDLLSRSLAPDKASKLRGLDKAYSGWLRVQNAASRAGAQEGTFTPAQLQAASRQMDQSLRRKATSRGQAVGQEFADAGRSVLSQNVPNSGTTDRALLAAVLGGAGYINPYYAAAAAAPTAAYTPWGQNALVALLAGRQGAGFKAGANALRGLAGPGAAAAPALLNANNR